MALNGLFCADVSLKNYSLTDSVFSVLSLFLGDLKSAWLVQVSLLYQITQFHTDALGLRGSKSAEK